MSIENLESGLLSPERLAEIRAADAACSPSSAYVHGAVADRRALLAHVDAQAAHIEFMRRAVAEAVAQRDAQAVKLAEAEERAESLAHADDCPDCKTLNTKLAKAEAECRFNSSTIEHLKGALAGARLAYSEARAERDAARTEVARLTQALVRAKAALMLIPALAHLSADSTQCAAIIDAALAEPGAPEVPECSNCMGIDRASCLVCASPVVGEGSEEAPWLVSLVNTDPDVWEVSKDGEPSMIRFATFELATEFADRRNSKKAEGDSPTVRPGVQAVRDWVASPAARGEVERIDAVQMPCCGFMLDAQSIDDYDAVPPRWTCPECDRSFELAPPGVLDEVPALASPSKGPEGGAPPVPVETQEGETGECICESGPLGNGSHPDDHFAYCPLALKPAECVRCGGDLTATMTFCSTCGFNLDGKAPRPLVKRCETNKNGGMSMAHAESIAGTDDEPEVVLCADQRCKDCHPAPASSPENETAERVTLWRWATGYEFDRWTLPPLPTNPHPGAIEVREFVALPLAPSPSTGDAA